MTIPETPLIRNETEKPFEWRSDNVGFRNKIGGLPDGLTEAEFPICDDCKQKMTFYGQLDSLNDDVTIADCGLIAVFLCFECFTSKSQVVSS